MCVGGERKKKENVFYARARTKDDEEARWRRWTRVGTAWTLINETYAAAADTETHCKYGVPKKKLLSPGRDLYLSQLHSRRGVRSLRSFVRSFDPSSDNSFGGAPSFCVDATGLDNVRRGAGRRYSCIYMGQQMPDGRW